MPSKRASKLAVALPNEIWLEIFNKVETACLRDLSLVCKHWNKLIFTHLSGRFVLNFNVDHGMFPQKAIGMAPDRHYRHLTIRSFRLDSLDYLLEIVKRLAVDLHTLNLKLVTLDCQLLQQLLGLCTRIRKLKILAQFFENGETLDNRMPILPSIEIIRLDIEKRVSTFKPVSLEMVLLPCIREVQQLEIVVHDRQDLVILESLAPRLKALKATVSCYAIFQFFEMRLPKLESFEFDLLRQERKIIVMAFERTAFRRFLQGCEKLRNVSIEYEFDAELLSIFFTHFSKVRTLKLCNFFSTDHCSLNGLEKIVHLKKLSLRCILTSHEILPIIPMPTVEEVNLYEFIIRDVLVDILKRFPNIKRLKFPIRRYIGDDLKPIEELAPQLKHLHVFELVRITSDFINDATQLVGLRSLKVEANVISRGNFRLLSNVIVLPTLGSLTICTGSIIPISTSRSVLAKNPSCKLIVNNELIRLPVPRVAAKRKRLTVPVANSNQSAPSTDESQPSYSGSSSSGNLIASDSERDSVSFSTANSSTPAEKRRILEVSK